MISKLFNLFLNSNKNLIYCSKLKMSTTLIHNNKFNVFATLQIPDEASSVLTKSDINLVINENMPLTRDKLLDSVRGYDALFCTLNEKIDKELLERAGDKLKIIATCSVGFEHIDLKECKRKNIKVGYTPGVLTDATAEYTIGLLLNTSRRISEATEAAKKGEWGQWQLMWMTGKGIHGSTVGIFGLGRIGLAVAKRLINFNPEKILYHNRSVNSEAESLGFKRVELETLLNESDFLICTCASNSETEKKFNLKIFEKMKKSAIFINVSRGNVVNQADLCIALKNGIISAAGLDVTTPEPLPLNNELFKLKNCVISPHICSAETTTRIKMSTITAQNIVNGLNGQDLVHEIKI